jgi:hypothetical protein
VPVIVYELSNAEKGPLPEAKLQHGLVSAVPRQNRVIFVNDDWIRPAKTPIAVRDLTNLFFRMDTGVALVRTQLADGNARDFTFFHGVEPRLSAEVRLSAKCEWNAIFENVTKSVRSVTNFL